ncbi:MAG: hypothetical protein K0R93_2359 [Anaerosolibacter sp.]|jgi:hypothetical protein|uniref:hypothetical protein n=1 Tax=Anaerosolibacter sp. TaxID=1872527 RepID=UPI0026125FD1|nr:hypothetical protein [Anaerosolibacter sp.]MDF2547461.1 hypothetical protein [Anaerosolibacter sp.]
MGDIKELLEFDGETQRGFDKYIKDHDLSEEKAIRNLTIIGLSYYYADKRIKELEENGDFSLKICRELMVTSAKYASLKFNYFEMKKDYDRLKLQVSGLVHENKQYQASLQHAAKTLSDYSRELTVYKEKAKL